MTKEQKFTELIKDNEGVIFKITTVYTNNESDQKDLYQDIVYQLWKSFDSFRNESKISTWMYRVALNTAISHLRSRKKQPGGSGIDKIVQRATENEDQEFEDRLKILYAQIQKLNVLEKGLMLLLLEGKKYQEIAEITGLTESNVGTRISRIKQKLKSRILKS
ncbi:RNA polymerase sigma factor [Poritiphilus flavus]|uniref:Sigma-70 family RNA polymerase sigma factor n=1 Tax=Poritiphilus flavus TaxID=2697053 RepID=A0A6L9EFE9_9FLAO|nr:sigma-70 family RNA polymerase sigma factor [Poritiphilus flavus]NAS13228.1 sigma-70 family RNA polymerase sigma factor [Poritiphilus flavus]